MQQLKHTAFVKSVSSHCQMKSSSLWHFMFTEFIKWSIHEMDPCLQSRIKIMEFYFAQWSLDFKQSKSILIPFTGKTIGTIYLVKDFC